MKTSFTSRKGFYYIGLFNPPLFPDLFSNEKMQWFNLYEYESVYHFR